MRVNLNFVFYFTKTAASSSTGSFGRIEVSVVEANRYVVSSSVINIVTTDISGSTNFGVTQKSYSAFLDRKASVEDVKIMT